MQHLRPELVVFVLDQCLWHPEMYTLREVPSNARVKIGKLGAHGEGAIGAWSGREVIQLFPGALEVLQLIYLDTYPGMRIAAASSADTPLAVLIAKGAISTLEILPGVTMRDVFARGWDNFEGNMQIGRTPPLSANKASTHFPNIRSATGISYDKMLFFDDCSWEDNCGNVERKCHGVVGIQTPNGLQIEEWYHGLEVYSKRYST